MAHLMIDKPPASWNMWALVTLPISVTMLAKTRNQQIDALYDYADDPATPRDRAMDAARIAAKLLKMP